MNWFLQWADVFVLLGAVGLACSWVIAFRLIGRVKQIMARVPKAAMKAELEAEVNRLSADRDAAAAACLDARREQEASAAAAAEAGVASAALVAEVAALREEKKRLTDRVKEVKEEERRSREANALAERERTDADKEARRLRHELEQLNAQVVDAEARLGQLRRESAEPAEASPEGTPNP